MTLEMLHQQPDNSLTSLQLAVGIDTHQSTHHVAVIDAEARRVADREFPATRDGYTQIEQWLAGHGEIAVIGIESTSSYGQGITRHLLEAGHRIVEVNQPDVAIRHDQGKTDVIDAYSAARAALTGRANVTPKISTGIVESIRMLMVTRASAIKSRSQAVLQIRDLTTTAPDPIRDQLLPLTGPARAKIAAGYRPDMTRIREPLQAVKYALKSLAQRYQALDAEVRHVDQLLDALVAEAVPTLLSHRQIGTITAGRLVVSAGQNPHRFATEAQFAKLTGTAPLPASSGKTRRYRLNRGGDRQANSALYMIAVGRLKDHEPTRTYMARRLAQGLTKRDVMRCLKRYIAREVFTALKRDLARLDTP